MTYSLIRFTICFVMTFCVLLISYLQIPDDFLRSTIYPLLIVSPSLFLLKATGLSIDIQYLNNVIYLRNNTFLGDISLEIVRGCDACGFLIILLSAIVSYPATLRGKLMGVVAGVLSLWLLNIIRISTLIYLKKFFDQYFNLAHTFVWPILLCLFTLCIVWFYLNKTKHEMAATD